MHEEIGYISFTSPIILAIFVISIICAIGGVYAGLDYAFNISGFPNYYMSVENGFHECYATDDEHMFICYRYDGIHHDPDMESKTLNGDEYYCYTITRGGNYHNACVEIASINTTNP